MGNQALLNKEINNFQNTSSFTEENFEKIKEIMYTHTLNTGSFLFMEDDAANKLFYVKKGVVKLTKTTADGKEYIFGLYGEGDLIGDISGFDTLSYTYNAFILKDSEIGFIQQKDLEVLLWQHGSLAIEFMKWTTLMGQITKSKMRDLTFYGKAGALASTLIRLSNSYGIKRANTITITRKMKNGELGEYIGSTRESVNRMLSDLKKKAVISQHQGYIVIHDLQYLKSVCHCEECPLAVCRM
ncbi:Crp/Fnr family transcriptional regulator [Alteribacillus bidgolensis]|uniref:CRP/FNR family transcriptional regulator, anaerobic regulatory protein n=1 Tax=Alteribacillus bidgolensis TaxID=930129 RepID=A0A1G8CK32_9BACI|nr:Crp/Fnr family transcriptional regulator [Alteribacillus bidgolensis]SDH45762.1 CRP/FNR family transcriptional regulator, anaerobic regulatory protein [Alteribacillus bidgolensis]